MSKSITAWPNIDHCVQVSNVLNPVTHVLDVAIKNVFIKLADLPFFEDIGNDKSMVPIIIINRKLLTMDLMG